MWVRGFECARPCTLLSTCLVFLHAVRVFIGCVHSCYVLCCVPRSLCFALAVCFHVVMFCVNTWLMSILISCLCPVLHMASDLFCWPMCLCFLFCVSTWLVLFCSMCHVTPPILLPDYWFICPTCSSLSSSIAPFKISLCFESWVGSLLFAVYALCPALPCPASLFFPYGVVFVCFVYIIINKNPFSLLHLSPRPLPLSIPDKRCLFLFIIFCFFYWT